MKLRTNVVCAYACAAILGVTSSTVFAQDEASESDNDPELVEEQPEQDNRQFHRDLGGLGPASVACPRTEGQSKFPARHAVTQER